MITDIIKKQIDIMNVQGISENKINSLTSKFSGTELFSKLIELEEIEIDREYEQEDLIDCDYYDIRKKDCRIKDELICSDCKDEFLLSEVI